MKTWNNWLINNNYAENTIIIHNRQLGIFKRWCESKEYDYQQLDYKSLIEYIQFEQDKKLNQNSINNRINTIKKYYDYLQENMFREDNPARKLKVKPRKQSLYRKTLAYDRLETIYKEYLKTTQFYKLGHNKLHQRNKVILGLMIYQAVNSLTLKNLEVGHIDLEKGTIYLPSTKRSSKRTIPLQPHQILPINTYLIKTRDELQLEGDTLFGTNVEGIVYSMFKYLKKSYLDIKNANQIRNSTVMHWIKLYKLREVQYLAGHKYISTTEEYQQDDIEGLKNVLDRFHPMG